MGTRKYLAVCILLIVISGLIGVRYNTIYSGADEAAHFDYINYLIENKRLPTIDTEIDTQKLGIPEAAPNTIPQHSQHEAVQPPLYYVTAALLGSLFPDVFTRLMVLRFFGVLLLTISFYLSIRTYQILIKEKVLDPNHRLFFLVSLLFMTSPYFLKIMIPLNNEHLLLTLVSILIYLLTKYYFHVEITFKQVIVFAILTGAIILTKNTAAFLFFIVAAFLFFRKKHSFIILFSGIVILMMAPWFFFNYTHYQALTGMKQHINIVAPIVNPTGEKYTVFDIITGMPFFFSNMWFWLGEGVILKVFYYLLNVILILTLFYSPVVSFKNSVFWFYTISVFGNIMSLIFATLTTDLFAMHGRYLYMNFIPFVILTYSFITKTISKKYQNLILLIILIAVILYNFSYIQIFIQLL